MIPVGLESGSFVHSASVSVKYTIIFVGHYVPGTPDQVDAALKKQVNKTNSVHWDVSSIHCQG